MNNPMQHKVKEIMASSSTLQATDTTLEIVAYQIVDYLKAHYILTDKKPWYGVDIDAKIKQLKQEIAIAYSYKNKEKTCINSRAQDTMVDTKSNLKSQENQLDMFEG